MTICNSRQITYPYIANRNQKTVCGILCGQLTLRRIFLRLSDYSFQCHSPHIEKIKMHADKEIKKGWCVFEWGSDIWLFLRTPPPDTPTKIQYCVPPENNHILQYNTVAPENNQILQYNTVAPENSQKLQYNTVAPENNQVLQYCGTRNQSDTPIQYCGTRKQSDTPIQYCGTRKKSDSSIQYSGTRIQSDTSGHCYIFASIKIRCKSHWLKPKRHDINLV